MGALGPQLLRFVHCVPDRRLCSSIARTHLELWPTSGGWFQKSLGWTVSGRCGAVFELIPIGFPSFAGPEGLFRSQIHVNTIGLGS